MKAGVRCRCARRRSRSPPGTEITIYVLFPDVRGDLFPDPNVVSVAR